MRSAHWLVGWVVGVFFFWDREIWKWTGSFSCVMHDVPNYYVPMNCTVHLSRRIEKKLLVIDLN